MSFDFSVAFADENRNLADEFSLIKSAYLYADKVNVISPMFDAFFRLYKVSGAESDSQISFLFKSKVVYLLSIYDETESGRMFARQFIEAMRKNELHKFEIDYSRLGDVVNGVAN